MHPPGLLEGRVPGEWLTDTLAWSALHQDQTVLSQVSSSFQPSRLPVHGTTLAPRRTPLGRGSFLPGAKVSHCEDHPRSVGPATSNRDTRARTDLLCLPKLVLRVEGGGKHPSPFFDMRRVCEWWLKGARRALWQKPRTLQAQTRWVSPVTFHQTSTMTRTMSKEETSEPRPWTVQGLLRHARRFSSFLL